MFNGFSATIRFALCSTPLFSNNIWSCFLPSKFHLSSHRMDTCKVQILEAVEGYDGRKNTVVVSVKSPAVPLCASPTKVSNKPTYFSSVVVYFGGDVQDTYASMMKHRDNRHWADSRSLEATVAQLAAKFSRADCIMAVRPAQMYLGTFSSFVNFVESDQIGNPTFSPDCGAWKHMVALVVESLRQLDPKFDKDNIRLSIIGFSKGCVVLNQLLHEAANQNWSCDLQLDSIYWLDCGHNGGRDVWMTNENLLKNAVANLPNDLRYEIHVTPYQVVDDARPWKGKEESKFCSILRSILPSETDRFIRKLHFEHEERSLDKHFEVLDVFIDK